MDNSGGEHKRRTGDLSTKKLIIGILKLSALLLWTIFKVIIRSIYKGTKLIIAITKLCITSFREWWRAKSTQEKIASIRRKIRILAKKSGILLKKFCVNFAQYSKIGLKFLVKWSIIGTKNIYKYTIIIGKLLGAGVVWLCINTVHLVIHMKPTIIRMGKAIKIGWFAFRVWIKRVHRGIKLRRIRRRSRYLEFKRKGGFKHILENANTSLQSSIASFMEEDQGDVQEGAVTEDDILEEEIEEIEKKNKAQVYGKKFFTQMKNIIDIDEEA